MDRCDAIALYEVKGHDRSGVRKEEVMDRWYGNTTYGRDVKWYTKMGYIDKRWSDVEEDIARVWGNNW